MTAPIEEPSPLMAYLLAVLATLMAPALPDVHRARLAAREAIAAHQARGAHEQMTIAQIAAFAVAALDTLRLSMPDDVSLSMKLKLRGNANGLNRSAHDNTQILERGRRTAAPQQANLAEQAAAAGWDIPETPPPPAEPSSRPNLASAMQAVAARLQASTATASPAQRKNNAVWADTLTNVADEIAQGKHKPAHAGTSKAQLLRTTLLAGGPAFPSRAPQ
jgi:hypothetical protein